MRIVIDTNVLISALLWKKKLTPLYHLINQYKITLCFSKATLAELIRVASYPHIAAKAEQEKIDLIKIIKQLTSKSILSQPLKIPYLIQIDQFDNHFLACAQSCGANFIISGDKHLLKLKEFQGIPIVSPSEFLKYFK